MRDSLGTHRCSHRLNGVLSLLLASWRTRLGHERPERAAECRPHVPTHGPTRGGSRSQRSGVVGNGTLLAALAGGFGGAIALLLVVGITMILRNRRSARATEPSTPL